jgi:hypothetical protein
MCVLRIMFSEIAQSPLSGSSALIKGCPYHYWPAWLTLRYPIELHLPTSRENRNVFKPRCV